MRLTLVVVVVVLGCALSSQANLLLNPSFETQGVGGSWDPANWARSDGNDRTDSGAWGAEWVQDGSYVMNLNRVGGVPTDHTLNQDVNVEPMGIGDIATFSIYGFVNDNAVFTNAYIDIGFKGGVGGETWSSLNMYTALSAQNYADGFVPYTVVITNQHAEANQVSIWLNVQGFDDSAGNANVIFDSADLTVIPEPMSAALFGLASAAFYVARRRRSR